MTDILKKRKDFDREIQGETSRLYATIASKIYDAIDAHGISKEDLAKRVGIPLKYLSQLLDGEFPITIKMMVQLATALGFKWNLGVLAESHEGPKAH